MANTYTYRIISLKKRDEVYPNVIRDFVVELTASNGSDEVSDEFTVQVIPPNGIDSNFIEYQELQESDLIGWFQSDFIEHEYAVKAVDTKLEDSTLQSVAVTFPWI